MRYKWPLVLVLAGLAGVAQAQIQNPGAGGGIGGAGSINIYNPTSSTVVATCTGTIDLSTGCVQPMLAGIP